MLELMRDFVLKGLGYVAPFIVRWFYPKETFSRKIIIKVRSEGDGIAFFGGELPHINIWLTLTNLTPYEISFENIYGQVSLGSVFGEIVHIKKHSLRSADMSEILIKITLNELQLRYIERNANATSTLYISSHIHSTIYDLEISKEINTNNVRFVNFANSNKQELLS